VFTPGDDYCGVDLDGCLDPDTGDMEGWAREIIEELDSYTEVSPSGTGVHVLIRAALPGGATARDALKPTIGAGTSPSPASTYQARHRA
jgi:primase-polymerase (primpol)-like protein